jgi:hypothetical protein
MLMTAVMRERSVLLAAAAPPVLEAQIILAHFQELL